LIQWITTEESRTLHLDKAYKNKIEEELADIATYLLNLCNVLKIDLGNAIAKKLEMNAQRYPVDLVRGKAGKYKEYRRK
ncbi:unnamed protein product, partial [marine sediment metagenome]